MKRLFLSVSKGKELRFLGHLDYLRTMERAVLRARIPVAFSEGFNPHIRLSFDSALGVGVAADPVYMDLRLSTDMPISELKAALEPQLPQGIVIHRIQEVPLQTPKLTTFFNEDAYEMEGPVTGENISEAEKNIEKFNELTSFQYKRVTPKKVRVMDVKPMIIDPLKLQIKDGRAFLTFSLIRSNQGTVQPKDIWNLLAESFQLPWTKSTFICSRTGAYLNQNGKRETPFTAVNTIVG
jgi:radical SAM-linked protein